MNFVKGILGEKGRFIPLAILLLFLIFFLGVFALSFKHPPLIGLWEGHHIFNTFFSENPPEMKLVIQQGADTAGQWGPHGYALVQLSRRIMEVFHLDFNLWNIRILSVVYGIITLFAFFLIIKRWFGNSLALVTIGLLSVNLYFINFEHVILPQMLTFACVGLCIERFQKLFQDDNTKWYLTAFSFGLVVAVTSLQYLLGRIYLVIIFFYFIKMVFTEKNSFQFLSKEKVRLNLKKFFASFFSFLVYLRWFEKENISLFFRKGYLASNLGEYATDSSSALENLWFNFLFSLKAFYLGLSSLSLDAYTTNIIADAKLPVISFPIFVLFLIGLLGHLRNFKEFRSSFTLFVLGLLSFVLYLSDLSAEASHQTTLSPYRVFFLLIPIYICVPMGLSLLADFFQKALALMRKPSQNVFLVFILALPFLLFEYFSFFKEIRTFREYVESFQFDFDQRSITENGKRLDQAKLQKEGIDQSRFQKGFYHLNQIYLYKLSKYIFEKIASKEKPDSKLFINLSLKGHTPQYSILPSGLNEKPFLKIFLCLYLNNLGVSSTYLVERPDGFNPRIQPANLIIVTEEKELAYLRTNYSEYQEIVL